MLLAFCSPAKSDSLTFSGSIRKTPPLAKKVEVLTSLGNLHQRLELLPWSFFQRPLEFHPRSSQVAMAPETQFPPNVGNRLTRRLRFKTKPNTETQTFCFKRGWSPKQTPPWAQPTAGSPASPAHGAAIRPLALTATKSTRRLGAKEAAKVSASWVLPGPGNRSSDRSRLTEARHRGCFFFIFFVFRYPFLFLGGCLSGWAWIKKGKPKTKNAAVNRGPSILYFDTDGVPKSGGTQTQMVGFLLVSL